MKRFRKRTVIYITVTAMLLSLFSISSLTLGALATDDGESSAVSDPVPEYVPAPALPIEMVVPSDELYMNYPDVAAALECLPVTPLPDDVSLFQYFDRLWVVEWLEAEIEYAVECYDMPAAKAEELTATYVTPFYTRAKEMGLNKYIPIDQISTFSNTDVSTSLTNSCWSGSGSATNPYQIKTRYDLEYMAYVTRDKNLYNCYFILVNDITLTGYNDSNSWTPIGGNTSAGVDATKPFRGHFDGNNKTISGLYVNQTNRANGWTDYIGLFGVIGPGAVIKDLTVNATFKGLELIGGIAGYAYGNTDGFTISNCTANVTITGGYYLGGIVGRADNGVISNCKTGGSLTRPTSISYTAPSNAWDYTLEVIKKDSNGNGIYGCLGGVVGVGENITISKCVNDVTVVTNQTGNASNFAYVGGVAGYIMNKSLVVDCENKHNIVGVHYVGGIVGTAVGTGGVNTPQIISCISYSNSANPIRYVQATGGVGGGILGCGKMTIIRGCQNKSNVIGYNHMGGIVGNIVSSAQRGSVVEDCINGGKISGTDVYIGGIVGASGSVDSATNNEVVYVNYCRNYGEVDGTISGTDGASRVGGIAGRTERTSVEACTSDAVVCGGSRVAGIIGEMVRGEMILCHVTTNCTLRIIGTTSSGTNEGYEQSPLGGGFVACLEVDSNTKLQASLMQGHITAWRNGAATGKASEWENVASRVGWANVAGGLNKSYICYRWDYNNSVITSEVTQLYNFFLLIDTDLSPSGMAYGTEGGNHAIELFPLNFYYLLIGNLDNYLDRLEDGYAVKCWTINAVDNGINKVAGELRTSWYGEMDGHSIVNASMTNYSAHDALYYWLATGNKISSTPLIGDFTNRLGVQFVSGLYLSPVKNNPTMSVKLTYVAGSGAPTGIKLPGPINTTIALQGRNVNTERTNAKNQTSNSMNATTDLGTATVGAITGLDENGTIVSGGKRYYFKGYKDANNKFYTPGDTISYSLWGDRAGTELKLTALWVSGYSVRYELAPSLVGKDVIFAAPISPSIYPALTSTHYVLFPNHSSVGHSDGDRSGFAYWTLEPDGSGKRYYKNDLITFSDLESYISGGELTFYYVVPTFDLQVTASMNGPYVDDQTSFVYELTNKNGFKLRFTLKAQQTVTIAGLVDYGDVSYTLTQVRDWSWKYDTRAGAMQRYQTANLNSAPTWNNVSSNFTYTVSFAPQTVQRTEKVHVSFVHGYSEGRYLTNLNGGVTQ